MKKLISNLWFQVSALVFIVVLAAYIRQLFPSNEPGQISPLFFKFSISSLPHAIIALAVILLFYLYLRHFKSVNNTLKLFLYGFIFLVFSFTINSMSGWDTWIPGVFGEYFESCKTLIDKPNLLSQWALLVESANLHISTHPPGICLYIMLFQKIFGDQMTMLVIINIFLSGLSAVFIYRMVMQKYSRDMAYIISLMYLTAGNFIIYSGVIDAMICALSCLLCLLMYRTIDRKNVLMSILIGVIIGIGSFITYQFCFLFCIYILWVLFNAIRPDALKNTMGRNITIIILPFLGFFSFFILLYWATGFDWLYTFTQQQKNYEKCYGSGQDIIYWLKTWFFEAPLLKGDHRSYLLWVPGNILAYMFIIGPISAILFWRSFSRSLCKKTTNSVFTSLCLATGFGFLIINLTGLVLGETERIWLYMLPFFVVSLAVSINHEYTKLDYRLVILINLLSIWLLRFICRPLVF